MHVLLTSTGTNTTTPASRDRSDPDGAHRPTGCLEAVGAGRYGSADGEVTWRLSLIGQVRAAAKQSTRRQSGTTLSTVVR